MQLDFGDDRPIFLQIADGIEDAIFTGAYPEESQIPSTTEISAQMRVNPATVLKGMNLLVGRDILYKKRGVGMFVKEGAVGQIRKERQERFFDHFIKSLLEEARKLGLTQEELKAMIERGYTHEGH